MRKIADFVYVRVEPSRKIEAVKVSVDQRVEAIDAVKGLKNATVSKPN